MSLFNTWLPLGGLALACLSVACTESVLPRKDASASITPTNAACTPTSEGSASYQIYPKGDNGAAVGDVMPFYDNNTSQFYLYYLKDVWDATQRHPWYGMTTGNFYNYGHLGSNMLGSSQNGCDMDYAIGTGGVVHRNGTFYAFYTAHNPNYPSACVDKREVIKLATSSNLYTPFVKQSLTIYPPAFNDFQETDNFRDPYVYLDEATGTYYLLISARKKVNNVWRGVIAKWTSSDLTNWTYAGVLYDGGATNYWMMECAQLFKINSTYYLLYSDQTANTVYYRKSSSLNGPWSAPSGNARLDGAGFYGARAGVDKYGDWYLFGWTGRKQGNVDNGASVWGGNLVTHKIYQKANGDLAATVPHTLQSYMSTTGVSLTQNSQWGNVTSLGTHSWKLVSTANYNITNVLYDAVNQPRYRLHTIVNYASATKDFGLALTACDGYDKFYSLRFIPSQNRISLDTANHSVLQANSVPLADVPFTFTPNTDYDLTILFEGSMMVVYVNNEAALTARVYRQPGTRWGVYADNSTASFKNIAISKP